MSEQIKPDTAALKVDAQGNVFAGEVKICRMDAARGVLLFLDKDHRRSAQRGSDQVAVPIIALAQLGARRGTGS